MNRVHFLESDALNWWVNLESEWPKNTTLGTKLETEVWGKEKFILVNAEFEAWQKLDRLRQEGLNIKFMTKEWSKEALHHPFDQSFYYKRLFLRVAEIVTLTMSNKVTLALAIGMWNHIEKCIIRVFGQHLGLFKELARILGYLGHAGELRIHSGFPFFC